jgi:hypothetical protein
MAKKCVRFVFAYCLSVIMLAVSLPINCQASLESLNLDSEIIKAYRRASPATKALVNNQLCTSMENDRVGLEILMGLRIPIYKDLPQETRDAYWDYAKREAWNVIFTYRYTGLFTIESTLLLPTDCKKYQEQQEIELQWVRKNVINTLINNGVKIHFHKVSKKP